MTNEYPYCHTLPAPHLLIQRAVLHSWQDATFKHRARVNFHESPNKHSFYLFLCYYRCTVILKHLNVLFCLNKTFQGESTLYKSSQNQLIEVWRYTQGLWGSLGAHRFCLCSPWKLKSSPCSFYQRWPSTDCCPICREQSAYEPWARGAASTQWDFFCFQIHPPR